MNEIWGQNVREAMTKAALYQTDLKYQRKISEMKNAFRRYKAKLQYKALSTQNTSRRRRRLERVEKTATRKVREIFGPELDEPPKEVQDRITKIRVIENGYHPDLVYADPALSKEQRIQGIRRVCGRNLENSSNLWLLENIWKAMKEGIPVPIVLTADKKYSVSQASGFVKVPFNFEVWEFADFLEEHLDTARERRKKVLDALKSCL